MIHLYLDLFYETFNAINRQHHKQIHFLSLIFLIFWYLSKKKKKSSSMISSVSWPIEVSMLSLRLYIVCISSESLEYKKLIDIIN